MPNTPAILTISATRFCSACRDSDCACGVTAFLFIVAFFFLTFRVTVFSARPSSFAILTTSATLFSSACQDGVRVCGTVAFLFALDFFSVAVPMTFLFRGVVLFLVLFFVLDARRLFIVFVIRAVFATFSIPSRFVLLDAFAVFIDLSALPDARRRVIVTGNVTPSMLLQPK